MCSLVKKLKEGEIEVTEKNSELLSKETTWLEHQINKHGMEQKEKKQNTPRFNSTDVNQTIETISRSYPKYLKILIETSGETNRLIF